MHCLKQACQSVSAHASEKSSKSRFSHRFVHFHMPNLTQGHIDIRKGPFLETFRTAGKIKEGKKMAERVGFEPTVPKGHNGFRDRPVRPLRHLSACRRHAPAGRTSHSAAVGPQQGGRDKKLSIPRPCRPHGRRYMADLFARIWGEGDSFSITTTCRRLWRSHFIWTLDFSQIHGHIGDWNASCGDAADACLKGAP